MNKSTLFELCEALKTNRFQRSLQQQFLSCDSIANFFALKLYDERFPKSFYDYNFFISQTILSFCLELVDLIIILNAKAFRGASFTSSGQDFF